ncbi:hypothetical protein [Brevibacterium sp.]|uniref:hypothetical protein n=1 Tax=Brevibacterium sp. TaxID=1701 RepID=UPI00281181BB|nr:hypothetical protein [Brevibacterium sp.]
MVESFEVFADRESIEPTSAHEGTNAARFAMMAALGPGPNTHGASSDMVVPDGSLASVGLDDDLMAARQTLTTPQHQNREVEWLLDAYAADCSALRREAFADLQESGTPRARLALLAAGLSSGLERESVTAAAALLTSLHSVERVNRPFGWTEGPWTWSGGDRQGSDDGWQGSGGDWQSQCEDPLDRALRTHNPDQVVRTLRDLAELRVRQGWESGDAVVREISLAPFLYQPKVIDPADSSSAAGSSSVQRHARTAGVSTMVHGTWDWKDTWWYPGGDFHTLIQRDVRADLYDDGQEFSWSGALSEDQRNLAGQRFHRWAVAAGGGNALHTVFAFSYGSEVLARAVNAGVSVDEVVFLSAPVNAHHRQMLDKVRRVVDIRLKFDIVLAVARTAQRLPSAPNVHVKLIDRLFWSHSATHDPEVWEELGLAAEVGLVPQA